MSLLYTPGQLRRALGLPLETYRHWKKALASMRRDSGHSPCFTPGDLVAVAVVQLLTEEFGIRVGMLAELAEPLFKLFNQSPWALLERSVLTIEVTAARVALRPDQVERSATRPMIVIPLGSIVASLRETMLATDTQDDQGSLRFPPTALPAAAGTRR